MSKTIRFATAALIVASLAGCASSGEKEFGSSVRHMVEGQTYDPSAPRDTVGTLDGRKAAQAIDAYHAEKKAAKGSAAPALTLPVSQ